MTRHRIRKGPTLTDPDGRVYTQGDDADMKALLQAYRGMAMSRPDMDCEALEAFRREHDRYPVLVVEVDPSGWGEFKAIYTTREAFLLWVLTYADNPELERRLRLPEHAHAPDTLFSVLIWGGCHFWIHGQCGRGVTPPEGMRTN
jgi:hypothetical protein